MSYHIYSILWLQLAICRMSLHLSRGNSYNSATLIKCFSYFWSLAPPYSCVTSMKYEASSLMLSFLWHCSFVTDLLGKKSKQTSCLKGLCFTSSNTVCNWARWSAIKMVRVKSKHVHNSTSGWIHLLGNTNTHAFCLSLHSFDNLLVN